MVSLIGRPGSIPALLRADGITLADGADVLIAAPGAAEDVIAQAAARGDLLILHASVIPAWLVPAADHLVYHREEEAALAAIAAVRHPRAFRPLRAFARLAARSSRAADTL